jgi:5'-3' exonuclease
MSKPLILIDTSYTSFYRFFATIRWFSFAYPDDFKNLKNDNKYDWASNKIFIEKYEKMYLDSIIKLVKKKIFDNSHIIFCMDSPKENLWRNSIQTNYKGDRCDLSLKHNFKTTFNYTYEKMIPNIIKQYNNIKKIRMDKLEADDIIAAICMNNLNKIIYLVSGDDDFLQLGNDNIIFINYKKKKPFKLTTNEAYHALMTKIIMGDPSDCIPSIIPKGKRINKKNLINDTDKLLEYLENNLESKRQYEHNQIMINFKNIPKKYIDKVNNELIKLL